MSIETVEEWAGQLQSPSKQRRLEAVRSLSASGAAAVEPLAEALQNEDFEVRIEAARTLEAVGDERAIPLLRDALRSYFIRKSPRFHRYLPLLLGLALAPMLVVWVISPNKLFATIQLVSQVCGQWFLHRYLTNTYRKQRSRSLRSLTRALAAIAERNPSPEFAQVVDDLRVASRDRIQHDQATREAALLTARQIEALTGELRGLPVIAANIDGASAGLPRPAHSPPTTADTLPRVGE